MRYNTNVGTDDHLQVSNKEYLLDTKEIFTYL
jgi:hypothetical protein